MRLPHARRTEQLPHTIFAAAGLAKFRRFFLLVNKAVCADAFSANELATARPAIPAAWQQSLAIPDSVANETKRLM